MRCVIEGCGAVSMIYRRKRKEIVSEGTRRDTMENLSQHVAIASRQTELLLSRQ